MIEYYRDSKEDFNAFLRQCKYALKKCGLHFDSVNSDWLSGRYDEYDAESLTVWEGLKQYGNYSYNCDGIAIDFEYDNHVYCEVK